MQTFGALYACYAEISSQIFAGQAAFFRWARHWLTCSMPISCVWQSLINIAINSLIFWIQTALLIYSTELVFANFEKLTWILKAKSGAYLLGPFFLIFCVFRGHKLRLFRKTIIIYCYLLIIFATLLVFTVLGVDLSRWMERHEGVLHGLFCYFGVCFNTLGFKRICKISFSATPI